MPESTIYTEIISFFMIGFSKNAYLLENSLTTEKQGFGDETLSGDPTQLIEVDFNKPFDVVIECNSTTRDDILVSYFPSVIELVDCTFE